MTSRSENWIWRFVVRTAKLCSMKNILLLAVTLFALEGIASAQGSLVASMGKAYGGSVDNSGKTYAIAVGGGGAHSIGSELEFARNNNVVDLAGQESKLYTLMASIVVGVPVHTVRPYVLFGYGFIRERTQTSSGGVLSDLSNNDVGYNAGAGVTYHFSRAAGVRFDLRHFKVRKADGLSFQRIMVGLVLGG